MNNHYELIICDIWGVLHNGKNYFPKAVNFLKDFIDKGGLVILVTNAPRRSENVRDYLLNMGIDKVICQYIVSSGDCTFEWLNTLNSSPLYHLGPPKDNSLFNNLNINKANFEDCKDCICTGFFDEYNESIEDYDSILNNLKDRLITLHCANPDLYVNKGPRVLPCAGLIAQKYEEIGGKVVYFGKPYSIIYDQVIKKANEILGKQISKKQVLAIGDGLYTDIMGASINNIDTLFITDGVHKAAIDEYIGNSEFERNIIIDFIEENNINIEMPKYIQRELDFFNYI